MSLRSHLISSSCTKPNTKPTQKQPWVAGDLCMRISGDGDGTQNPKHQDNDGDNKETLYIRRKGLRKGEKKLSKHMHDVLYVARLFTRYFHEI